MKTLILFTLALVVCVIATPFLPLSVPAMQIVAGMLGSNAVLGLSFIWLATYYKD